MKQINDSQIVYTDETITVENKNTFKENITEFVNKHAEIWKFIKFNIYRRFNLGFGACGLLAFAICDF